MATDIFKELSEIDQGRYGVDIRFPIHDALVKLSEADIALLNQDTDGYPVSSPIMSDYDIEAELNTIQNDHDGASVKQAIYSALSKLSRFPVETRTVVTGLNAIDLQNASTPSGSNYISDITGENDDTDWNKLIAFLQASGLFTNVMYDELEGFYQGIAIYDGDTCLAELYYMLDWDDPSSDIWSYRFSVYMEGSGSRDSVFYPPDAATLSTRTCMAPITAYRTDHAMAITCQGDAIVFAKNSDGGVSVTFGCGTTMYNDVIDPRSRIRTFSLASTKSNYGGFSHSHHVSDYGALTALISEGDDAASEKAYGLTSGSLSDVDGIVQFGTKHLYIASDMLAIEI